MDRLVLIGRLDSRMETLHIGKQVHRSDFLCTQATPTGHCIRVQLLTMEILNSEKTDFLLAVLPQSSLTRITNQINFHLVDREQTRISQNQRSLNCFSSTESLQIPNCFRWKTTFGLNGLVATLATFHSLYASEVITTPILITLPFRIPAREAT